MRSRTIAADSGIAGVAVTPLRVIAAEKGRVLHVLRSFDVGFAGFGEAYFSTVECGAIKGWRRHRRMTLNLVVPIGQVEFRAFDDRWGRDCAISTAVLLSPESYCRLTVPPGIWLSFRGGAPGTNLVLNIANLPHDPAEADVLPLDEPAMRHLWGQMPT